MLRLLAAAAVLAWALPGSAAGATRWSPVALEGARSLHAAGAESGALVVLRSGLDPVRSFDGGATWTPFRIAGMVPTAVRGSPTDSHAWYAEVPGSGVYRTRDGGETWTRTQAPSLAFEVGADPSLLYAVRTGTGALGLRVSTDGGDTWQDRDFPAPAAHALPVPSAADANLVFVVTDSGVLRSRDRGATWVSVRPPAPQAAGFVLTLDRRDPDVAYALQAPLDPALWVTRDGGATWTRAMSGLVSVVADPIAPRRAYAGIAGTLFETRDAGLAWVKVDEGGRGARPVVVVDGRRIAVDAADASVHRLDLADGSVALGSDLWWNPAESGAGLTITQHASNRPFVVWYTYDATGAPAWRVIPGGQWNDRTFTGEMFETTGPPYFTGPFDPSRVATRSLGSASLTFESEDSAVFTWNQGGTAREKRITRQLFAPAAPGTSEHYADLWWNSNESGWGIAINQQHNRVFAAWYVYGDDGRPLWVVMPDAVLRQEFIGTRVRPAATGDIYTTRGPAEGAPFDPAQVVPTRIGTATLRFVTADSAELEYTAFGRTATRVITRQPF